MVQPNHERGDRDPVEWAREETFTFTRRKLKRYGLLSLIAAVAVALLLKGMPGHFLWPVLGVPLIIAFACVFTPTLYYGAMAIGEWIDRKQHP